MARKERPRNMMRMKELMDVTGVTKATIRFYVDEGLIPKPVKTHPNMAYYDQTHVNAIRMIKELQTKRYLPLSAIKQIIMGERGGLTVDEIQTLVEIDGKFFRSINGNPGMLEEEAQQLSRRTGVRLEDMILLEEDGILSPRKRGKRTFYSEDDIRVVEGFGKLKKAGYTEDLGFDTEMLSFLWAAIRMIVEQESKRFLSQVTGKVPAQNLPKMLETGTVVISTILGVFHKKAVVETSRRYSMDFLGDREDSGFEKTT
jgi:DNA-binding transcriptional MerR regulator